MKRLLPALAALAFFWSALCFAQEKGQEKDVEFTFKAVTGTKYVSEFGLTYLNEWFIGQTSELSFRESGFYGAVSNMYAPGKPFNSGEDAGWFEGWLGNEGKAGPLQYDAYVGYYVYQLDRSNPDGDAAYAGLKVKLPQVWGLTPFLGAEYFYVPRETGQSGFVWRAGAEYKAGGLRVKLFATGHDRLFGTDPAALASGIASAEYAIKVHESIRLVPALSYQQRVERKERDGGFTNGGFWGVLSAKFTF
jgi:hypothetical protein